MIEALYRFILTAQIGNITKTSEKIFITQSALSQSLKKLEHELGTKLFVQKGKHLELTADGVAVTKIGNKILTLWQNLKDPTIRKVSEHTFSIGMFDNAALLSSSYLQHPASKDFRIELTINASGNLFLQLKWGILDLAICVIGSQPPAGTISLVDTFEEELIPVSSKTFKGELSSIPFILYNTGSHTRDQINTFFSEMGIIPQIFAESTSTTFMKELAVLGNGIALLPKNFIQSELQQGILKKQYIMPPVKRYFGIYINTQSALSKNHVLVREIAKHFKKSTHASDIQKPLAALHTVKGI